MNKEKLFFEIIEKFRIHIRLREIKKFTKNIVDNSTFSTFLEDKFKSQTFFFRDNLAKFI